MKVLFTRQNEAFTNVKLVTKDGIKTVVFNGEADGRGKSAAIFWSEEEMIKAVKQVAKGL